MQEMTMDEVEYISAAEAGVPHSDYYYGGGQSWWAVLQYIDLGYH